MPISFLVTTANGQTAVIDDSVLIEAAFERLRWPGQLELQLDPSPHTECQGSLLCIAREVHSAQRARWEHHDAGRYLILATRRAELGSPDLLSITLIDTRAARAARTETEVLQRAVRVSMSPELISDRASMAAYLDRAFLAINRALQKAGHHQIFGRIRLEIPEASRDLQLALDGGSLGALSKGGTTVSQVTPGQRDLTIRTGRVVRFRRPTTVEPGGMTKVSVTLSDPPNRYETVRGGLMWSGLVALAVGAGLSGYGAYLRSSREGRTTLTTGGTTNTIELDLGLESGRDVILPAGMALAGVGIGLGIGLLLLGDDDSPPWLQLVASAVLGGGLFAVGWVAP